MIDLSVEKKKLELVKVRAAKAEMEYRIKEREVDIKRLQDNILIQDKRITELEKELSNG